MSINENNRIAFLKRGKQVEADFSRLFNEAISASKEEDIKEHWDVQISAKIDVKGLKKKNRSDVQEDENFHWVELSNVNGGKRTGSLYGKADFLAFETLDYWILVETKKLQDFIESKCKGKKIENTKEPYTFYRREGRKDILVRVKTLDLMRIAITILDKKYNNSKY